MAYTFNGTTKRVTLPPGMVTLDLVDMYSRWKEWVLAGNAECLLAFSTVGGEITEIPLYLFMLNGWLIVPQAANHTLSVINGVLVGQASADPFTDPAGSYKIRINRQVPGIAIGYSTTGGGGGSVAVDYPSIAAAVRQELTVELQRIDAAISSIVVSGGGGGSSTLTAAEVRAELAPELAKLDVPVSSRMAAGAIFVPPTAVQNAAAVRAALASELNLLDVAVSSRIAAGGTVNANIKAIHGINVTGDGTLASPWKPE